MKKRKGLSRHGWALLGYDLVWFLAACVLVLLLNPSGGGMEYSLSSVAAQSALAAVCLLGGRFLVGLYDYVWRYGSSYLNIRMMFAEIAFGVLYYALQWILPMQNITFLRAVTLVSMDLLGALGMRQIYQFLHDASSTDSRIAKVFRRFADVFMNLKIQPAPASNSKIYIAIVGAGRVGVSLAENLFRNPNAPYVARCFIDIDPEKIGRSINGLPVLS